jgi:putative flippase GtrA
MGTVNQVIKYGIVGVLNTIISLAVIWVMMKVFGCREGLSNISGYIAGIINSFLWNKQWTFRENQTDWGKSALRFLIAFGICYALQWSLVLFLNHMTQNLYDHYYNHLIGMVFYTIVNFIFNKFYAFKA